MLYRITFLSDEKDNFKRVFEADAYSTFLDLHKAFLLRATTPTTK